MIKMTTLHQILLPGEADSGLADDMVSISTACDERATTDNMLRAEPSTTELFASREKVRKNPDEPSGADLLATGASNKVAAEDISCVGSTSASRRGDITVGTKPNHNLNCDPNSGNMQRTSTPSARTKNGNGIELSCADRCNDKAALADRDGLETGGTSGRFDKPKPQNHREVMNDLAKLFACFMCGIVFGVAAEKGRVFETATIRGQFIYQRWIMLKMFLSAAASSCLCLALLAVLPPTRQRFEASRTSYVGCLTQKGVTMVTIGGAILGAGMVLSGSCPGMVLVQIGAWLSNGGGGMTFLGCMVAVFVYALVEPWLNRMLSPTKPYEKYLADGYMEKWKVPFVALALGAGVLMGLVVLTLELLVPWTSDLASENVEGEWFFQTLAWPPYVSGIMIGLLQIPLVLIISDTIGGSSSYCTLAAQVLCSKKMESWLPYLAKYKRGVDNWWQVFYVGGAIVGACLSAAASRSLSSTPGVSLISSFLGGFLLIFGARLAGGCTSGHGLSGMGVLSVLSFLTVAAMFAGGTAFGFIFWAVSNSSTLDYWTF